MKRLVISFIAEIRQFFFRMNLTKVAHQKFPTLHCNEIFFRGFYECLYLCRSLCLIRLVIFCLAPRGCKYDDQKRSDVFE